jgi:CHC2 zinc finger/Toprim-like
MWMRPTLLVMEEHDLLDLAIEYHENIPDRIRAYLNHRGIPNNLMNRYLLGYNGVRIAIPVFNRNGELAFFKLAKDPEDQTPSPKMLATRGASAELYGWDRVLQRPSPIIICEGEFDRLVLESQGFAAVTSTGGAGTFRQEWAKEFEAIPEVYVCFDNDEAGRIGAARIGEMIPHARLIALPEEVGPGGDVTDFFVRLGKGRDDFLSLIQEAHPAPVQTVASSPALSTRRQDAQPRLNNRVERIKSRCSITDIIGQYVRLHPSGNHLIGRCPFHEDRTPSFVVYPSTGTFHCFGCRTHGDLITFLMKKEGLGFGQALCVLDQLKP